jgi:hypothetical protein
MADTDANLTVVIFKLCGSHFYICLTYCISFTSTASYDPNIIQFIHTVSAFRMSLKINNHCFLKSLKQQVLSTAKVSVPFKVPNDMLPIISIIFERDLTG